MLQSRANPSYIAFVNFFTPRG
ncbi:hypothetical protein VARIO8X_70081 [Burkholderiales bacterium 8X]|nr:hypothetical protein VARIO8X_70081 [Burkholderiales bacterium 8X]